MIKICHTIFKKEATKNTKKATINKRHSYAYKKANKNNKMQQKCTVNVLKQILKMEKKSLKCRKNTNWTKNNKNATI